MFAHLAKNRISLGALALVSGLLLARVWADTPAKPATQPTPQSGSQPASHPAPLPRIVVNEEVVLDFFHKYEPDVYKQMTVLREKDRTMYDSLMKDFYKEVAHLLDLQRKNEPLFEITMEDRRIGFTALQLARSIQSGNLSGADLDNANSDLAALLSKQFDLRQQIRQAALDEQKARLEDIQKTYDTLMAQFGDREKSKDELIKQRMADLMNKNPKVEW